MTPKVSIILPTCDRVELLRRAVESVQRQTLRDWELIIVDNNRRSSPVVTQSALQDLFGDVRIRVESTNAEALTAGAVRNIGLAQVRGEWTTFLDDDDAYAPRKLERQLETALQANAPFVLCGYAVHLPRRVRVRQTTSREYVGDDLLWKADWGTPFQFHRSDPACRFDETLSAGEDMHYAQIFLKRHRVDVVPNCAEALVEVYPQLNAPRVHRDGEAIWAAYRATCRLAGGRYSRDARRKFLAKGRLVRAQFGYGDWSYFTGCVYRSLQVRGWREWRLAINATLRRTGWLKRWTVA